MSSMVDQNNPITPAGYETLRAQYHQLYAIERPKVVEIVSWAAGNGDRSENGDYIYGKQRLRQIDRDVRILSKKIKSAQIINPLEQPDKSRVFFGATVELADEDDSRRIITLIGDDEAEPEKGRIGWNSPLARALRGAAVGDLRAVRLPSGRKEWEVMAIGYA